MMHGQQNVKGNGSHQKRSKAAQLDCLFTEDSCNKPLNVFNSTCQY